MTAFQRAPRDVANAFLREVEQQGRNAGRFIELLMKGDLGSIAPVSDALLTSLEIAAQRFNEATSDYEARDNLACALRGVALFGCAWQPQELQERGFDALQVAYSAALEANVSPLYGVALGALTHLAPFFDASQLEEIASRDTQPTLLGIDSSMSGDLHELTLASPRQLLLRDGHFQVCDGVGVTLNTAGAILAALRDVLSSPASEQELKVGELLGWARDAIQALYVLVPEIARSNSISHAAAVTEALRETVDALSWFVMASNRIDAISEGRISTGEPLQRQIAWSPKLLELRDLSWLVLGLITRQSGPWAGEYSSERVLLQARALDRIRRDCERGFFSGGRLPLELFLYMTGCSDECDRFEVEDGPARALDTLRQFQAGYYCPPHRVDGVGAALAGWDENIRAGGGEVVYPEQLRDLAAQALRGRAFQLDAQAFLIRAVHDVR
jgi:hypothetical protein